MGKFDVRLARPGVSLDRVYKDLHIWSESGHVQSAQISSTWGFQSDGNWGFDFLNSVDSRSSETPVNFDSDVHSRKDGSCGVSRADFTAFGNTVKNYCNDRGSDVSKKICDTIILEYASTKEGPWVSIGKYPGRISD